MNQEIPNGKQSVTQDPRAVQLLLESFREAASNYSHSAESTAEIPALSIDNRSIEPTGNKQLPMTDTTEKGIPTLILDGTPEPEKPVISAIPVFDPQAMVNRMNVALEKKKEQSHTKPEQPAVVTPRIQKPQESTSKVDHNIDTAPAQSEVSAPDATQIMHLYKRNVSKIDQDMDGKLSRDEVGRAISDRTITGPDAAFVAVLKQHFELIANARGTGDDDITPEDLFTIVQDAASESPSDLPLYLSSELHNKYDRIAGSKMSLYGNPDDPLSNIRPDSIAQGNLNDCHFLSQLSSLANTTEGRQKIHNMISTIPGGYSVKFPGVETPIFVPTPSESELALYASGGKDGYWPAVLEKAFAKHYWNEKLFGDYVSKTEPIQDCLNGPTGSGYLFGFACKTLTGKDSSLHNAADVPLWSNDAYDQEVANAIIEGRIVVANASQSNLYQGRSGYHVYTVLDYDTQRQTVKLRNPWGHSDPSAYNHDGIDDGVFEMPMREFKEKFLMVSIQDR